MKPLLHFRCRRHVLVCVNERQTDESCCSKVSGYEIFRALKDAVKAHGLASSVWVTRTGCLGFCNDVGATVVIYPEGEWLTHVTKDDIPGLIKRVLL